MKKCKHEQKCIECIQNEISKLEKQLNELKKQLPRHIEDNSIEEETYHHKPFPFPGDFKGDGTGIMRLCSKRESNCINHKIADYLNNGLKIRSQIHRTKGNEEVSENTAEFLPGMFMSCLCGKHRKDSTCPIYRSNISNKGDNESGKMSTKDN